MRSPSFGLGATAEPVLPKAAALPRRPEKSADSIAGTEAGGPIGLLTLTVMLGVSMATLDTTVVNVALANMAGSLGATTDEIAWVATGYILACVVIFPLNGWLTALFGRRRFYAASIAIFTLASFFCGMAHSVSALIICRIAQGIGAGALQPTAQAILFESYPEEGRGRAMAIFGAGATIAPALGPTLGGLIVDNFSWPFVFWINVPIGVLAFIMALAFVRDSRHAEKPKRGADWVALSAMAIGIASLEYVLQRGEREDWFDSASIEVLTLLSIVSLTFFIVRELRDTHPLVDLRVFRLRSFSGGSFIVFITGFGLAGFGLMLPLFYQDVLRFNAALAGLALLPGAVAAGISMHLAAMTMRKIGAEGAIAFGLAIFALGSWWMGSLNQSAGYWDVFYPRTLQGLAVGFVYVPLTTATLSNIGHGGLANASGIYMLIRELGGGVGIAVMQSLEQRREEMANSVLSGSVTLANPAVARMFAAAHDHAAAVWELSGMVQQNATAIAYSFVFRLSALAFAFAIPTVYLLHLNREKVPSLD